MRLKAHYYFLDSKCLFGNRYIVLSHEFVTICPQFSAQIIWRTKRISEISNRCNQFVCCSPRKKIWSLNLAAFAWSFVHSAKARYQPTKIYAQKGIVKKNKRKHLKWRIKIGGIEQIHQYICDSTAYQSVDKKTFSISFRQQKNWRDLKRE